MTQRAINILNLPTLKLPNMRIVIALLFLVSSLSVTAQTLFTVDGEDTSVAEFKKMYEKNSNGADDLYTKSH